MIASLKPEGATLRSIRIGFLEADDCFTYFSEPQFFARVPFDRLRVISHRCNLKLTTLCDFFLPGYFPFESEDFRAHTFILFDERKIPDGDSDLGGNDEQKHHGLSQLVPNSESDSPFAHAKEELLTKSSE